MAEGFIEGVFGRSEEPEQQKVESTAASGADPTAIVVAMEAIRLRLKVAQAATNYLNEQRELVRRQCKSLDDTLRHVDEEHRAKVKAANRKRLSDILKISLQMVLALIGLAGAVAFAGMFVSAIHSRSVIVEQFNAPSALAPSGLTGEVVGPGTLT